MSTVHLDALEVRSQVDPGKGGLVQSKREGVVVQRCLATVLGFAPAKGTLSSGWSTDIEHRGQSKEQ